VAAGRRGKSEDPVKTRASACRRSLASRPTRTGATRADHIVLVSDLPANEIGEPELDTLEGSFQDWVDHALACNLGRRGER